MEGCSAGRARLELGLSGTNPWACQHKKRGGKERTDHGNLTLQLRNRAARPSRQMSVTKALPLVKKRPARAGRTAKASGELCQWDGSSRMIVLSSSRPRLGRIKSPAVCRVSSKLEKESSEERRRGSNGSTGEAPSETEGVVLVDKRLRTVKDGGRGRADDEVPATSACGAPSGEGGADAFDGLVMMAVGRRLRGRSLGSCYARESLVLQSSLSYMP